MWKCELCKKEFEPEIMAVEVRFGYVDVEETLEKGSQYDAFCTENAIAPICDNCAVKYVKGEKIDEPKI